jgi:hypothetical protein
MLTRINRWRERAGFKPVSEEIRTLDFAETLGVGSSKATPGRVIRVGE